MLLDEKGWRVNELNEKKIDHLSLFKTENEKATFFLFTLLNYNKTKNISSCLITNDDDRHDLKLWYTFMKMGHV